MIQKAKNNAIQIMGETKTIKMNTQAITYKSIEQVLLEKILENQKTIIELLERNENEEKAMDK